MNRTKFYPAQIALLVIVGILGFILGRRSGAEPGKLEFVPIGSKAIKAEAQIEKRSASIDAASVAPAAVELKSPPRSGRLQEIADLNQVLTSKISVPMILGGNLNPEFVALFEIPAAELKTLNDAVAKAKTQIAELGSIRAQIEPKGGEKFTITIPTFPKEGGLVLDEFMKTVRSTLGEDRYAYFNSVSRSSIEREPAFSTFGLTQTVINLEDLGGKNGTQSANSTSGFDEEHGGTITVNTGLKFLKVQYPAIVRKLIDSGIVPPESIP